MAGSKSVFPVGKDPFPVSNFAHSCPADEGRVTLRQLSFPLTSDVSWQVFLRSCKYICWRAAGSWSYRLSSKPSRPRAKDDPAIWLRRRLCIGVTCFEGLSLAYGSFSLSGSGG